MIVHALTARCYAGRFPRVLPLLLSIMTSQPFGVPILQTGRLWFRFWEGCGSGSGVEEHRAPASEGRQWGMMCQGVQETLQLVGLNSSSRRLAETCAGRAPSELSRGETVAPGLHRCSLPFMRPWGGYRSFRVCP